MSSYTTVILTCQDYEDNMKTVPTLNKILASVGEPIFERATLDDAIFVLIGNYLPLTDIIGAVNALPWYNTDGVQLWYRDEHHDRFTEVELNLTKIDVNHVMEWTPCADGEYDAFSGAYGTWTTKRIESIVLPGEDEMSEIGEHPFVRIG